MILYWSIIIGANILIWLLNLLVGTAHPGSSFAFVVIATALTTAFQFLVDGIFAIIIAKMPDKYFSADKTHFDPSPHCRKFYEKLQIRKWKDKVWELGGLGGFRKNKINEPNNPAYIEQFIIESNKGIVTHRIGYFVGFLGILILPFRYALTIGLPVALVNLFLNILPTMILRYNLPRLRALHKRLTRIANANTATETPPAAIATQNQAE